MSLTFDEFEHAMTAVSMSSTSGLMDLISGFSESEMENMDPADALSLIKSAGPPTVAIWDLTRPDSYAESSDLLGDLIFMFPDLEDEARRIMKTFTFHHFYRLGGDGVKETFLAYAGGKTLAHEDMSKELMDAAESAISLVANRMGVPDVMLQPLAKEFGTSPFARKRKDAGIDVDASVKAFAEEMDGIFSSWNVGEP